MGGRQGDSLEVSEGTEFKFREWEPTGSEIEFHYGGTHWRSKVSCHECWTQRWKIYRFVHVHSYKFTEKLGCEASVMIHGERVSTAIDCSFLTSTWQALSSTDTFDWHYGNWVCLCPCMCIYHVSREGLADNSKWLFIDIHQNHFMKIWPYDVIVLQISVVYIKSLVSCIA